MKFKIGYASDFHMDFYIDSKYSGDSLDKRVVFYVEKYLLPEDCDVMILSGDLSHYTKQIFSLITYLKQYANSIIVLDGNHEKYLVSKSQMKQYNKNSFRKINEIKEWCLEEEDVYFLDGNIIELWGLRIGGTCNWYDLPTQAHLEQWNQVLNDSNYIIEDKEPITIKYAYSYSEKISQWDTQSYRQSEKNNLIKISNEGVDIFVTHICPIIIPDQFQNQKYIGDKNNIFYMTDDIDIIKASNAKICIFGHQHDVKTFEEENIEFKINAQGYPKENLDFSGFKFFNYENDYVK